MPSDTYYWLAKFYDHLFDFRRPFSTAHNKILFPLLPRVGSACDLACGTGSLAMLFAAKGIETYAVDLSPEMCRLTRRKARRANLPVRVIEGDMRTFVLPKPVDLITCEFDAINHLPRKLDLGRTLKSVHRALNSGGFFLFDANNRLAFERIWAKTWFLDADPVAMVMRGSHKRGSDRAVTDIDCFVRKGKSWKRYHEHVEEICWSAAETRRALRKAGFDRIQTWDAAPLFDDAHTQPGNRTFWLARKE